MSAVVTALGLVLVIEGLLWGGFPGLARRLAEEASRAPDGTLRAIGVAALALGVAIVWAARHLAA